ncbi:MAG: hypothetical protein DRJ49_02130 [Thermoprotei archaeon]|nr:MAG: hypothetical protein DRN53_08295 [Thermoprotei archaeon]RLE89734.1 MAG: hypothetical protein DRJ49_02130 [Thermoprotei archaeon]
MLGKVRSRKVRILNFPSFLTNILKVIKRGKLSIRIENRDVCTLEFRDRSLLLELKDIRALNSIRKLAEIKIDVRKPLVILSEVKKIANILSDANYTITLIWERKPIVVLGKHAKPGPFAKLLGIEHIEIKDIRSVMKLIVYPR